MGTINSFQQEKIMQVSAELNSDQMTFSMALITYVSTVSSGEVLNCNDKVLKEAEWSADSGSTKEVTGQ